MMRAILALVAIVLLMGLAGWLTIGHSSDKTSINIETHEIQRDTKNAIDNAEHLIKSGRRVMTNDNSDSYTDHPENNGSAYIEIDEEPVTIAPSETPVTSPDVTR